FTGTAHVSPPSSLYDTNRLRGEVLLCPKTIISLESSSSTTEPDDRLFPATGSDNRQDCPPSSERATRTCLPSYTTGITNRFLKASDVSSIPWPGPLRRYPTSDCR